MNAVAIVIGLILFVILGGMVVSLGGLYLHSRNQHALTRQELMACHSSRARAQSQLEAMPAAIMPVEPATAATSEKLTELQEALSVCEAMRARQAHEIDAIHAENVKLQEDVQALVDVTHLPGFAAAVRRRDQDEMARQLSAAGLSVRDILVGAYGHNGRSYHKRYKKALKKG
jgi:septal ring factor EnvC (AmiA/AmiB activator)